MLTLIVVGLIVAIIGLCMPYPLNGWIIAVGLVVLVPSTIALIQVIKHERWVDQEIERHNASDSLIKFEGCW